MSGPETSGMGAVPARRALLATVGVMMVLGVTAGLARFGWPQPFPPEWMAWHGPLMLAGVFSGVIALERAVALQSGWALAVPALAGTSVVALLGGAPAAAAWVAVLGGAGLCGLNVVIVRRQSAPFTWLMLLGSLALLVGDLAWALGQPIPLVVPAWTGFLVLTIVAERLELSRLAPVPAWARRAVLAVAAVVGGLVMVAPWWPAAVPAVGVGYALLGAWQLRFDLARRTVRTAGLPRYVAVGVLTGSAWLVVAGLTWALGPRVPAGAAWDAALHALFVGFVFAMVFAHAPIIFPSVGKLALPFHPAMYASGVVLHGGLVARLAGDALEDFALRRVGGLINAAALVVFAGSVLVARVAAPATPARRPG